MLEPAHIVGVSKKAYVPATRRRLDWRRGGPLPPTGTKNPSDPDSLDPCRRPAGRARGDRGGPRLPVAGVLVLDGVLVVDGHLTRRRPSRRAPSSSPWAPWNARRG